MSNLTSFEDIVFNILYRSGQNPASTDPYFDRAVELANRARLNLIKGICPLDPSKRVDFKWAIKYPPYSFVIKPEETTASSVSVTNNSTSITFDTSITADVAGYHIKIDGESDIYRISTHGGSTDAATLDGVFTGDTDTAATFTLMKLEYSLGSNDIIRVISPLKVYRDNGNEYSFIYGMDDNEFDKLYPMQDITSGVPDAYKLVQISENNWTIVFNKYSAEDLIRVEYRIIQLPSDLTTSSADSEILVPREYREVIADWGTAMLQKDKSDDRYKDSLSLANANWQSMVMDSKHMYGNQNPDYGRLKPRAKRVSRYGW